MKAANPYLYFQGNAAEAFRFYASILGGEPTALRYRDFPDNEMGVPDAELDRMAHISLPLGPNNFLMATDLLEAWPKLARGNDFSIMLEVDDGAEADRLHAGLSSGGETLMPLQGTAWAEKYGECRDRFGVRWIVMYTGAVAFADTSG